MLKTRLLLSPPSGGWSVSCRSSGGRARRVTPGSTGSEPAPAARGPWGSSGTRARCVEAAATASAAGAGWEQPTGSARCVTRTGKDVQPGRWTLRVGEGSNHSTREHFHFDLQSERGLLWPGLLEKGLKWRVTDYNFFFLIHSNGEWWCSG